MVDGYRGNLLIVVSGVTRGSVLGQLLFLLYITEHFATLENELYGYTNESNVVGVVSSPLGRVSSVSQRIMILTELVSGVTFGK